MSDPTNPLPGLLQSVVAGIARHFLTTLAGGLAVSAGLSTSQETQFITGGVAVIVWGAGVGWSIMQKKNVNTAITNPAIPDFQP